MLPGSFSSPSSSRRPNLLLRRASFLAGCLLLAASAARPATLPSGFTETRVTGGLSQPTAMAFAPDGRLFVAEQEGDLRVIKNGILLAQPFVSLTVSSSGERGLLGVAFDPNFTSNQFVYVYYTATAPSIHNRVSRFTASGDVAAPGSEAIILELDNLSGATNHNGGAIHFGPDGRLYVAVGENANGANSQTLSNLLGKILRINKDGSIPNDNPFFNAASGVNRAIWALGLRNPFTFSFHPGTGRMFINDVGQSTWEEINDGIAGSNYGWPATEGPTDNPAFRSPIFAYRNDGGTCAITGGVFYIPDTQQFPAEYRGSYFFSDFCGGWIRRLDPGQGNAVTGFATGIAAPVDLRVTDDGSLYYLARNEGAVYRVRFAANTNNPPVAAITSPPHRTLYNAGDTISYAGTGTDPEDGNLPPSAFTWRVDFHVNGQVRPFLPAASGSTGGSFIIPRRGETSANVFYRIHLTVRDSEGLTHSDFHDVVPRTARFTLTTEPPGLRLTLDGQPVTAPRTVTGVVGMIRTLGVVSPQTVDGVSYEFESWSDGGAATHEITTLATDPTYTARFRVRAIATGLGLTGVYFNNRNLTAPVLTRLDPTVSFDWGTGAPDPSLAADTFSVRWIGRIRPTVTGTYTFFTQVNDGVRLWVNGVRIINDWNNHATTVERQGTIRLTAGRLYDLRMEVFENRGPAAARLLWSAPGLAKQIVPQSQLYPFALLAAGSSSLSGADAAIRTRLEDGGYVPVVQAARNTTADDALGNAVVVVSSTVGNDAVGTRLRNSIVPIVTWDTRLFRDLGLTGPTAGTDHGQAQQSRIAIVSPHPLAAGLRGLVTVTTERTALTWGKPTAGAVIVGRLPANASRAVIFGYEKGSALAGLTAPARRVGLFLGDTAATRLTADGWALFDAAVRWVSGR